MYGRLRDFSQYGRLRDFSHKKIERLEGGEQLS